MTLNIARKRLDGADYALEFVPFDGNPVCRVSTVPGVGFYHVTLEQFRVEDTFSTRDFTGLDAVDNWSVGYVRDGVYHVYAQSARTKREPVLSAMLEAPAYSGQLAMCINDVFGRSFCYEIDAE
jgi:hypothetical protein